MQLSILFHSDNIIILYFPPFFFLIFVISCGHGMTVSRRLFLTDSNNIVGGALGHFVLVYFVDFFQLLMDLFFQM